jgi:uncharacterized membrane protein
MFKLILFKTILYRLFAFIVSLLSALLITNNIKVSLLISLTDLFLKSLNYFIFETLWQRFTKK